MATTKLTLSADKATVELAKKIASDHKISVSKLFKNLITEVSEKKREEESVDEDLINNLPEWLKPVVVAKKPTPDFDHKAEYGKHLEEKYGL